jgi:hypothetical protein
MKATIDNDILFDDLAFIRTMQGEEQSSVGLYNDCTNNYNDCTNNYNDCTNNIYPPKVAEPAHE